MVSRNGLNSRKNEKKISTIICFLFSFYILLAFLAPLLMEKGTVPELSGRANAIDYATEKKIDMIFKKEDIIVSNSKNDVTKDILILIDKKIKKIE